MTSFVNGNPKIDAFYRDGVLSIQNGFACGDWNVKGSGILQIRPFNITNTGQIDLGSTKYVETNRNIDAYMLQPRDVLFNNTNSEELVGKAALWIRAERAVLSNHMTILRVLLEDRLSPEFLSLYLLKRWFDGYFHAVCRRHVNQASVSTEQLRDTEFPPFDVSEQRKIASVLGVVQRAIEQQEQLIALTTELKKSLMHKLFTEGLRRERQKQTEIGPVPDSWEVVFLRDCCIVQTGIAKGRKVAAEEALTLPYLRVANVQAGHLVLDEMKTITIRRKEKGRFLLRKGDVVLTEGGDFDKLGRGFIWNGEIENCVHQNHIFVVRADRSQLLPEFFAHLSQSPYGKAYFLSVAHKTTNLACINTTKLKGFPVLIPPLVEQEEIVEVLETINAKLSHHVQKHRSLSDLFRTFLHQLMTAQIRVHDLDLSFLEHEATAG
jgi:type I restriction enzyme S subunit